ncbi:ADC synthase [Lasiosphaeria hispida]|uniref:ADC synthase n=1 Tax=Lasiosphaeria hispida TaxID=260671 RepID=A0AAJ0MHL3_9PEZI|nr:ADC synthase [Lasiosphaeria hispida]
MGEGGVRGEQWWESLETDAEVRSMAVPLPRAIQVPNIVEAVDLEGSERIVLDSANAASGASARADVRGRYSIIAAGLGKAPRIEYHTGDDYVVVKLPDARDMPASLSQRVPLAPYGDIWGFVASFHEARQIEASESTSPPFVGGFMGYITYEQGLSDIGISPGTSRRHHRPDVCLVWVTKSLVVDHLTGIVHIQQLQSRRLETDTWLESTTAKLMSLLHTFQPKKETPIKPRRLPRSTSIQPPLTHDYEAKVTLCQEYIAAGESYELCLTDQTTITRARSDAPTPWTLYKSLRTRQPAPFASYLRLGAATLLSASPERFLRYSAAGLCSMRPMKGTVRKSAGGVATLAQAEAILHVPKEEAENLMIVDLVRHDLHGVCGAGRVRVPELLRVEEYQSVFQMVTVVEGRLPDHGGARGKRYTGLDVLAASLPPGSMTGAPKRRSCEILRGIEDGRERGLYSGVVGYMCATGRGDWSVTIRSLFRWDDEQAKPEEGVDAEEAREVWRIGAGGAVTILSTAEGEREEMFTKLAGPLRVFADS